MFMVSLICKVPNLDGKGLQKKTIPICKCEDTAAPAHISRILGQSIRITIPRKYSEKPATGLNLEHRAVRSSKP
jgi:hypothetical protein